MTKQDTAKLLSVIGAVYSRFEINELKLKVWHGLLENVDYRDASVGLKDLLKESKFPPTPADIIEKSCVAALVDGRSKNIGWLEIEGDSSDNIGNKMLS